MRDAPLPTAGTALITGATSGIGAEFARQLAAAGYALILTGRRMEILEGLARGLEARHGIPCRAIRCELTEEADIRALERVIRDCADLTLLVNNAGLGTKEDFLNTSLAENLSTIAIHDTVSVRLTHAALPGMIARGGGGIVFTSSLAAFAPTPSSPLYGASKAFLNSFAESLSVQHRRQGIRFQALCPGFTHTDFHEKLGWERKLQRNRGIFQWMEADKVVRSSLRTLRKGQVICVPGAFYKLMLFLIRVLPRPLVRSLMAGKGANG